MPETHQNQSCADPAERSRPEYPSQSLTHHADTQISPITLKSSASKTPREKSGFERPQVYHPEAVLATEADREATTAPAETGVTDAGPESGSGVQRTAAVREPASQEQPEKDAGADAPRPAVQVASAPRTSGSHKEEGRDHAPPSRVPPVRWDSYSAPAAWSSFTKSILPWASRMRLTSAGSYWPLAWTQAPTAPLRQSFDSSSFGT